MKQAKWAREEFGQAELGDVRRTERLVSLGTAMAERSSTSLPEACRTWSEQKAGYRFFSNEAVRPDAILASHRKATAGRMAREPVVLAVQDTTSLSFSQHPATIGLGAVRRAEERGLLVHTTLAVTPERVPLGVLAQEVWTRDPATVGKRARRKGRPIGEKESRKWLASLAVLPEVRPACPTTQLVSVGDREADVYDLFLVERPAGVELLIRAAWDRHLEGPQPHLWAALRAAPRLGRRTVEVPRRAGLPGRTATVDLHAASVTIRPPCHREDDGLPPATVTAVWAIETAPPPDGEPIEWMLLTTLPVATLEQADRILNWYCCRWEIEVWHATLKSGCKIEQVQLATGRRLHRCLAVASIVAWRIPFAARLARDGPDLPCTVLLEPDEWRALACDALGTPTPPPEPPSLQQAVRWIAQLGGFPSRASDGEPGPTTLWRGFLHLADLSRLFRLLSQKHPCTHCG
jgi:hypothetical protein